jgi:hypothetical protein
MNSDNRLVHAPLKRTLIEKAGYANGCENAA